MATDDNDILPALLGLLSIPFLILWRGYVISILWGWFVVPLGARPINWALGIGISLVANIVHPQSTETEDAPIVRSVVKGFMVPLICLLIGWCVSRFL